MMTREENDRLCRIGPGTPMGALSRRFWLPICTSDRLPEPGCAPTAQRLLGEDFVVFRGRDGKVGVLDELCIHRNASAALRIAASAASIMAGNSARTVKCWRS